MRIRDSAPASWDQAIAGAFVLAALATGHYLVLYMTICYRVPPGILVLVTCPWQTRAVGFALFAVLALVVPFLLGLRRRELWTGILSPLGYSLALVQWQRTRGQTFAYDLTYDLSPFGFFMDRVAAYWVFMVVAFAIGHAVREMRLHRRHRDA